MKQGKISEPILKRSIIKEIKYKKKEVLKGSSVGSDAAIIKIPTSELVTAIATYSGEILLSGKRALVSAVNNIVASFASPVAVMISITATRDIGEKQIREFMSMMDAHAKSLGVQIAGGHTEASENVIEPVITVTSFGILETREKEVKPGYDIVMSGTAALEGTMLLAIQRYEELKKRFTSIYIDKTREYIEELPILNEAAVAIKHGVAAMHDTSKSGVFGALWEMGERLKVGMEINLKSIPIYQETVEICEFFDINPYTFTSLGGLIMVTEDGAGLVKELLETGKKAAIIGKVTDNKDKTVMNDDEKRFLEPYRNK